MKYPQTLKRLRKKRGYTMQEMAEKLSMKQRQNYYALEKNGNNIKVSMLYKLTKILRCSVSDLIPD